MVNWKSRKNSKSASVGLLLFGVLISLSQPVSGFSWSKKKKIQLPELNYNIEKPLENVRICTEDVRQCLACNGEVAHVDSDPRYKNKPSHLEEKRRRAHEPYVLLPKGVSSFKECHRVSVFGHGLSDGTAKVFSRAEDIRSAGACVYVFPLRGHLGTDSEKEALSAFDHYDELAEAWEKDYEKLVFQLNKENPNAELQLDGFSTSGLLAMKGCATRNGQPLYKSWKGFSDKLKTSNTFGNPLFVSGNSFFGVTNQMGGAHLINNCISKKALHHITNFGFEPLKGRVAKKPETPLTHVPMSKGAQCAFLSLHQRAYRDIVGSTWDFLSSPYRSAKSLKAPIEFSCHMRTYIGACDTVANKKSLTTFWKNKKPTSEVVIAGKKECAGTLEFNEKRARYYVGRIKAQTTRSSQKQTVDQWPASEALYTHLAKDIPNVGHTGIMYSNNKKEQCYTLIGEGSPANTEEKVSQHFRQAVRGDLQYRGVQSKGRAKSKTTQ